LIGDAGALALSGEASTPGLLAFVEGFQLETNFLVWSRILASLGSVKSVFSEDEAIVNALRKFTLKLVTPAVERIGWESSSSDFLESQLRAALIFSAGINGHEQVVAEAKRQFEQYITGRGQIDPSLRGAIFGIAVRLKLSLQS
jgi:hypothetical protein